MLGIREIIGVEEANVSCAICGVRKEKRFCPAVHGRICAQCCGEQREITLDCPSECVYLLQARKQAWEHEKPRDATELDRAAMFPDVEIGEQFLYEREELILGLSFALSKAARNGAGLGASLDGSVGNRWLTDRDLIGALSSLAESYRTLVQSDLIYEQATANLVQQQVAREVETMVKEFREAEVKHLGYSRLRDSEVLKALVFLLRMGISRTSGRAKSRAFVDFLSAQFPEKSNSIAAREDGAARIIVP
ncbi:MAG: hypothetical protein WB817_19035 [Terriglobales bacterium]